MGSSFLDNSGIQIVIQDDHFATLQTVAEDVASVFSQIEEVIEVLEGMEQSSTQMRFQVNKNRFMGNSFTVAQVYQQVVSLLNHKEAAITVQLDTEEYPVIVLLGNEISTDNLLTQSIVGVKDGSAVEVTLANIVTLSTDDRTSSIEHQNGDKNDGCFSVGG